MDELSRLRRDAVARLCQAQAEGRPSIEAFEERYALLTEAETPAAVRASARPFRAPVATSSMGPKRGRQRVTSVPSGHGAAPTPSGAAIPAPASPQAGLQRSLESHVLSKLEYLNAIGIALSQERDINRLLETILVAAKNLTRADGGTLYRLLDDKLHFEIMRNDSLAIAMGGTSGSPVPFYPIPLHHKDGKPNLTMIAAYVAINQRTVNIADAYAAEGFDFSGTRNFDKRTGYRTTSFLTVPMKNHEGEIIGVLQLLNATDAATGSVTVFSDEDRRLAESLASQAAIALTNRLLIQQLEVPFESPAAAARFS